MLNFKRVILHNFGSYGHAELDLRNRGFCLVSGKNAYKKDNAISNGSGKSFLWNAICFVFTGETLTGLHSNLKNINVTDDNTCYVELFFSEGSDSYHLIRIANPKSDLKIVKKVLKKRLKDYAVNNCEKDEKILLIGSADRYVRMIAQNREFLSQYYYCRH